MASIFVSTLKYGHRCQEDDPRQIKMSASSTYIIVIFEKLKNFPSQKSEIKSRNKKLSQSLKVGSYIFHNQELKPKAKFYFMVLQFCITHLLYCMADLGSSLPYKAKLTNLRKIFNNLKFFLIIVL